MIDSAALESATEVVVIRGSGYDPAHRRRNQRLAVERQTVAIRAIAQLVTNTDPDIEPRDWMEWPELSVVFLGAHGVLREFGLLSGAEWVRDQDAGDLPINESGEIVEWLAARGVHLAQR